MSILLVLVLLGTGLTVNSEIHSLRYIYTALSRPVGLPGIHQFTAVGLLDGTIIEYYDSENQEKVPRQEWMRESLPADYWINGTQSCKNKQQWFKENIDSLMDQMRQIDSDLHVLQWMHGCEGEMQSDGSLKFHSGIDKYAYDGDDFLSFDDKNRDWVAHTEEALTTKRKWDHDQVKDEYTKGYLENECMDWLSKLLHYEEEQLKKASPPEVFVFAKKARLKTNLDLTCFTTGFYPEDIILRIRRNGRVLTKEDGVLSSGVVPNNGDTFQRRAHIEILNSDLSVFSCEVIHERTGVNVTKEWGYGQHDFDSDGNGALIVAVGGLIMDGIIVAMVLVFLYKTGIIGRGRDKKGQGSGRSSAISDGGNVPLTTVTDGSKWSLSSSDSGVSCGVDVPLTSDDSAASVNQNQPTEGHDLLQQDGLQDDSEQD